MDFGGGGGGGGGSLGWTFGTTTLDHFLHLLDKGGAVGALEGVFPPLAAERAAALPPPTAAPAL